MYQKRLSEIKERKAAIAKEIEVADEARIAELETEVEQLNTEEAQLRKKLDLSGRIGAAVEKPEAKDEAEARGRALKEMRSVKIATTGILLPAHQATDIKPSFNEVSTLIDRVNTRYLPGGESFDQPYLTGYGTGDYTAEDGTPPTAEPGFDYATITKTKIVAYAEDSEELEKLPAADYASEVERGIRIAIRKKITKEILVGDGNAGHFVGIFSPNATAIDSNTDLSITAIDKDTLDNIIYSYGGPEDVEDVAVLVLNKDDLKTFAMLRHADGRKVYEVIARGNVGTINGVPYIINSACNAVSNPSTIAGSYCMCYGPLANYTMAIFSDLEIARSTDYKFKEGMIAHRGVIFAGGNVTAKNGFLRIKKKAAPVGGG